jgi:hypothetical protein
MAETVVDSKKWDLCNMPPAKDAAVGEYFYDLFDIAYKERLRLNLEERWHENHKLFKGIHWNNLNPQFMRDRNKVTANLFFANVTRTVANITARQPTAEVKSMDGIEDGSDKLLSNKLQLWWNETEQSNSLTRSVTGNEIYGTCVEKGVWSNATRKPDILTLDIFSWLPCPGYFEDINDMPYMCHFYPMAIEEIAKKYNVKKEDIQPDDVYSIMGEEREDNTPVPSGTHSGSANFPGNYSSTSHPVTLTRMREARALVIEIWCRDYTTEKIVVSSPELDEVTGAPVVLDDQQVSEVEEVGDQGIYPGGIRLVTVTNRGKLVLSDVPNPNINPGLPREVTDNSFLCNNYPFWKANSYEDPSSMWGFSAAEQVGDINKKIDELLSRIADYMAKCLMPPLIVPLDTGITEQMIRQRAGLVLQPRTSFSANGIKYLQVPNLPQDFFQLLELYVKFFDRISQIEDADRGDVPNRVVSGAAIAALQERGAVMMRSKIRATDYLVRQRGRAAISLYQNFGINPELVDLQEGPAMFKGIDHAGRRFDYLVESGSTVHKTQLQVQEQAVELYKLSAIDRQALLETLNFPRWKEIVERVGEGQLNMAMQVLVQAGLPQEMASYLTQFLMQNQGGPGNRPAANPADPNVNQDSRTLPPAMAKTEQGTTIQ